MKVSPKVKGNNSGFTMIEIAIALAVIGFALVAIIGILPLGLNVQKDNREDTIASQDGQYFMDVIRNGRQGTDPQYFHGSALDFLTNYVDTINIKTYSGTNLVFDTLIHDVTYSTLGAQVTGPTIQSLTNGHVIVGLLSTPEYETGKKYNVPGFVRHEVVATVRAMSGSASEQNGGNQLVAFKYQMAVMLMPYNMSPWFKNSFTNYQVGISDISLQTNNVQLAYWQNSLMDLRLQFRWPVLPNGSTGPNRKYFRTLASGYLQDISLPNTQTPDLFLYVINPGEYTTNLATF